MAQRVRCPSICLPRSSVQQHVFCCMAIPRPPTWEGWGEADAEGAAMAAAAGEAAMAATAAAGAALQVPAAVAAVAVLAGGVWAAAAVLGAAVLAAAGPVQASRAVPLVAAATAAAA